MAWLTTLALALVALGLLWNSSYSLCIYHSARKSLPRKLSLGSPRTISIVVPARSEPIAILGDTLVNDARACLGVGEVVAVVDDPLPRVRELVEFVASKGFPRNLVIVARLSGIGGRNGAMNDGVRMSRFEVVMVVDADVRVSREVVEEARRCRSVCVAPWRSYGVYGTKVEQATRFATDLGMWIFYVLKPRIGLFVYPLGAGTAIDRRIIEGLGLWRLDVIQDDIWLGVELASRGLMPLALDKFVGVTTPPTLEAAAVQLSRWSYGAIDVLRRFGSKLVRAPLPLRVKLEALAYILQPLQSLVTFTGLVLGVAACFVDKALSLLYPGSVAVFAIFACVSAAYAALARAFADSWGEELYREKLPFLLGRYSALIGTLLPLLAANVTSALLGLKARYRVTPKEVGSKSVPTIALASSLGWGACLAIALAMGNQPMAATYLVMVIAGIYCCYRFRGGG